MKIPMPSPPLDECLPEIPARHAARENPSPLVRGRYLHWDEVRHREPPEGLSHLGWWGLLKLARRGMCKQLPFIGKNGAPMVFCIPDPAQSLLHDIDRSAHGNVRVDARAASGENRERYLMSSLIEEAITSSQLEGAATTGREAKKMLRSGRRPRDHSERMIANNFSAMEAIRELREQALTPQLIFELHRLVSLDTLADASAAGRLRFASEEIYVTRNEKVLHHPPHASSLPRRMQTLCDFANGKTDGGAFVHPVVRAILLHFMIGYDHPFVDGNGRTARALFYWSMARANYQLMEYVSISSLLRRAPARYVRAYLHTETDGNDVTYFILHQLRTIERAVKSLQEYLARKIAEQRDAEKLLQKVSAQAGGLNHRQTALLAHALAHPHFEYGVNSHMRSHRVARQTARTDLQKLAACGLLTRTKRARAHLFVAPPDLRARIRSARA